VRRIFGPVNKNDKRKYTANTELRDRQKKPDLVRGLERKRLVWVGNLARVEDRSTVKMPFVGNPGGKRRDARCRIRWHGNVHGDLTYVGVRSVGQGLPRRRRRLQRAQGPVQAMKPQTSEFCVSGALFEKN
jgi:hypothetical protein